MKLKHLLYDHCVAYVNQRIDTAKQAIQIAQLSANEETKSSAGDKYETGRAMMQLEVERNTIQLNESVKLKQALDQINPDKETTTIQSGCIVITNQGNFYLAISVGQVVIEGKNYFAISPTSPIGSKLIQAFPGSSFTFNGKTYVVEKVI